MLGLKRNLKFEKRGLNIELGIYQRQGLHDVLQFLEPEFFVHPKKVPIWVRNSAIISNFRHWILAVVLQLTGHNQNFSTSPFTVYNCASLHIEYSEHHCSKSNIKLLLLCIQMLHPAYLQTTFGSHSLQEIKCWPSVFIYFRQPNSSNALFQIIPCEQAILPMKNEL